MARFWIWLWTDLNLLYDDDDHNDVGIWVEEEEN